MVFMIFGYFAQANKTANKILILFGDKIKYIKLRRIIVLSSLNKIR